MVVPSLLEAQSAAQGSPGSSECLPLTTYELPVASSLPGPSQTNRAGAKKNRMRLRFGQRPSDPLAWQHARHDGSIEVTRERMRDAA
jgi:hypothetical protein